MTVVDAVTYAAQGLFLAVSVYVAWNTISRPTRSNLYVLTFFTLLTLVIAYSWVQSLTEWVPGAIVDAATPLLVLTLPYVLLRLAHEYAHVPVQWMRVAEVGLLASYLLIVVAPVDHLLVLLALVSYFAAVSIYAAHRFHVGSIDANGITRKRLRALCIASILLGVSLFSVVFSSILEGAAANAVTLIRQAFLASSAVLYLVGFSPPTLVRRAWLEPELRQFLHQTLQLPRWSEINETLRYIERASAETIGAPHASIGLWNPETQLIDFSRHSFRPGETIGGRAFQERRTILSLNTIADDPESREIYEQGEAYAVMASPITTDEGQIGVLAIYSPNPPIFAEDDLSLLTLLTDQVSVLLENRKHLHAQAELAAREETTRLKDEFLSVAAHDLKTPLTTILATGQYLERRLRALGDDTPEMKSIARLNRESRRLRTLVQGLLDASRIERGELLTNLETTNLSDVINEVLERAEAYGTHQLEASISDNLIGEFDPIRMQQVVENLLENARKYSPPGSRIGISAHAEGDYIRMSVSDEGIGIRPEDREKVFDRYFQSLRSHDGEAPGIGLGLYICREIINQHGGTIWVDSTLGEGTVFHVSLRRSGVTLANHDTVDSRSG